MYITDIYKPNLMLATLQVIALTVFLFIGPDVKNTFPEAFKQMIIKAELSGGNGSVAYQHAQLFRQSFTSKEPAFWIMATIADVTNN